MRTVTAIIEKNKCHPTKCNHECITYDPINKSGGEGFHIGEHGKAEIDEHIVKEMHTICAKKCPFEAIHIVKLPEKLNEPPLHKYGNNSFELYRLPIVKKGTVVGVLGRNGVGKSTALNILAGHTTPNLSKYNEPVTHEDIIQRYSTALMGDYFTHLYKHHLKVSYKPQRIEQLSQLYDGTVHTLLKTVDERGMVDEYMELLDITHLKERTLKELSGGELQRVAIIATAAKKADIYYFDEPSSFLDITTRISMARLIRSLKDTGAAVMVVDHDLATLDYISDEIQIIYGEQACYGVVSVPKGVRNGINDYLNGFLPEDNVQFRPYKIHFLKYAERTKDKLPVLTTTPTLTKTYSSFALTVHPCELREGEVLGIMGANGLGKSTFLKLLAGIEQPDVGSLEIQRIAFKPQYPQPQKGMTVEEYLKTHAGNEYTTGWYQQNILEKLNLKPLLQNTLETLSGGELQKTYVAGCLSSSADILALDEPSAFIDVEDRIHIAEVIKEFTQKKNVACIVVDHDVQFIDYLADKILVFEGQQGKHGEVHGPYDKEEGMNRVLKNLGITYRKDKETNRARINKPNSQLDKEQKATGHYYH